MSDLLNIQDLHLEFHTYDGVANVLAGVSLSMRRGDVLGLVGETGCGKSMTALSVPRLIAMALAGDPDLLIADEPTTALDVTIQVQILRLIRSLVKQLGLTVLLITHNLGVVAYSCERVAVMYAGRVIEESPVREPFRNPQHPYTRGLIQAVPQKDVTRGGLVGIRGLIPNLIDPPAGCRFQTRCDHAMAICSQEVPPAFPIGDSHSASCFLHAEDA